MADPEAAPAAPSPHPAARANGLLALAVSALGVVYGDIGTSPLYALRECINPPHGVAPDPASVFGVLSLIFWSLTMVVTVKYLLFILRADNHGEGGILALLALAPARLRSAGPGHLSAAALLGLAGAALLYGDGIITPAISVLSAVEGLETATPALRPLVIPITLAILIALFAIQRHGTGSVGRWFGPVMALWFVTIAALGMVEIARHPAILAAVSPGHAARFFRDHGWHGFRLLGSVVLAVTGGEALYADLGHFGRRPIQRAWFALVFPALLLSYFGQGALVLHRPEAAASPFFALAPPGVATYLLVLLATAATVIASQALISGAFSLTRQAVQLGYFPRVTVAHTSRETEGQIYVPEINWILMLGCLALVLEFRASSRLAAAYGIAVSGTMVMTSLLFFLVTRVTWGWPLRRALPLLVLFLAFDLPFLIANLAKFADGGFVPVVVGALFFVVMVVWRIGRDRLAQFQATRAQPWAEFLATLTRDAIVRTPGTAVWMASSASGAPPFLVHHVARSQALKRQVVVLTIEVRPIPLVPLAERLELIEIGQGLWRLIAHFGFMEEPSVEALLCHPEVTRRLEPILLTKVTYYLGRETILGGKGGRMGAPSERIFGFLSRNQRNATTYFRLPPDQVVEIGTQIDL
jgi:KUP system potassium uptake protein